MTGVSPSRHHFKSGVYSAGTVLSDCGATLLLELNGSPSPIRLLDLSGTITITATSRVPQASTIVLMQTGIASLLLARHHLTRRAYPLCLVSFNVYGKSIRNSLPWSLKPSLS